MTVFVETYLLITFGLDPARATVWAIYISLAMDLYGEVVSVAQVRCIRPKRPFNRVAVFWGKLFGIFVGNFLSLDHAHHASEQHGIFQFDCLSFWFGSILLVIFNL